MKIPTPSAKDFILETFSLFMLLLLSPLTNQPTNACSLFTHSAVGPPVLSFAAAAAGVHHPVVALPPPAPVGAKTWEERPPWQEREPTQQEPVAERLPVPLPLLPPRHWDPSEERHRVVLQRQHPARALAREPD